MPASDLRCSEPQHCHKKDFVAVSLSFIFTTNSLNKTFSARYTADVDMFLFVDLPADAAILHKTTTWKLHHSH